MLKLIWQTLRKNKKQLNNCYLSQTIMLMSMTNSTVLFFMITGICMLGSCAQLKHQDAGSTEILKWKDGKKAAISLTYDDGSSNQFMLALPLMEENGFTGTFFINTGQIPGSEFQAQFIGRPVDEIIEESALVPTNTENLFERASAVGIGSNITLSLGGKLDNVFSDPVEVTGKVTGISDGLRIHLPAFGYTDLGRTVLLEVGSIRVVLATHRSYAINHPVMYTHLGLDPAQAKMIVLKTASNFQHFAPFSTGLIRADSPGMTQSDLREFSWVRAPRPLYPLDEMDSWQATGSSV